MILHSAEKDINEENVKSIIEGRGRRRGRRRSF